MRGAHDPGTSHCWTTGDGYLLEEDSDEIGMISAAGYGVTPATQIYLITCTTRTQSPKGRQVVSPSERMSGFRQRLKLRAVRLRPNNGL